MIFDFDHIRPLFIELPYIGTFKPPCRDVKWPWTCTRPEGHTGRHAADVIFQHRRMVITVWPQAVNGA